LLVFGAIMSVGSQVIKRVIRKREGFSD